MKSTIDERDLDTPRRITKKQDMGDWFCLYRDECNLKISPMYDNQNELFRFIRQLETQTLKNGTVTTVFKIFRGKEFKTTVGLASIDGDEKLELSI